MIASTLRLASLAATAILIASFAMFVVDETRTGSDHQLARLASDPGSAGPQLAATASDLDAPDPSASLRRERARRHGRVRELIDRADDLLLAPFLGVVTSRSIWLQRCVAGLLALLVFGFGLRLLAAYVGPRR